MILFQQFCKFFLTVSLVLLVGIFTVFSSENSLATTLLNQPISLVKTQIVAMNRVDAIGKDIEGKAQEAIGNVTGNKKDQFMGKAKQAESKVRNTFEDVKDATRSRQQKSKIEAQVKKSMDDSIVKGKDIENQYRNLSDR